MPNPTERVAQRLCQFNYGDDWERMWESYESIRLSYRGKADELLALLDVEQEVVALTAERDEYLELNRRLASEIVAYEVEAMAREDGEVVAWITPAMVERLKERGWTEGRITSERAKTAGNTVPLTYGGQDNGS